MKKYVRSIALMLMCGLLAHNGHVMAGYEASSIVSVLRSKIRDSMICGAATALLATGAVLFGMRSSSIAREWGAQNEKASSAALYAAGCALGTLAAAEGFVSSLKELWQQRHFFRIAKSKIDSLR